ncbi:hypothetical protein GCM10008957_07000 [Deinococcus ruber]|uniref:Uncharacterized protein n=1 Tax=Deinococcus ruber TaxID=1848197 RepID=A0A918F0X0_9DEIO|nr:hypothetical protein GCM10008957_07000 [Deinococcus ruber]
MNRHDRLQAAGGVLKHRELLMPTGQHLFKDQHGSLGMAVSAGLALAVAQEFMDGSFPGVLPGSAVTLARGPVFRNDLPLGGPKGSGARLPGEAHPPPRPKNLTDNSEKWLRM